MVIWKFPIRNPVVTLEMPEGSQVLTAQAQDKTLCLWAACDPSKPKVTRRFEVVGTGNPVHDSATYIATVQIGQFVWHLFELP